MLKLISTFIPVVVGHSTTEHLQHPYSRARDFPLVMFFTSFIGNVEHPIPCSTLQKKHLRIPYCFTVRVRIVEISNRMLSLLASRVELRNVVHE